MWDVPRYRIRAYVRSMRTSRARRRSQSTQVIRLRRVKASIRTIERTQDNALFWDPARIIQGRALLNDLSPDGLRLFAPTKLQPGEEISIVLQEPRHFYARAKVVWCHEIPRATRILTAIPHRYRIGIEFLFSSDQEAQGVREYCQSLISELLYPASA